MKKLLSLFLTLTMIFSLAACGTGIKAWHRKLFHLPPNSHTGEKIFRV